MASDVSSPSSLPLSSAPSDAALSSDDVLVLGLADGVLLWSGVVLLLAGVSSLYSPSSSPLSAPSGDAALSSGDALGLGLADGVVPLWQGVV